jgi:hypothetical protein
VLYQDDQQFFNPFHLHHGEDIFLHATVGEVDDFSREEIIAVKVEKHLGGIRMVDIANFELDALISQIHLSRLSFPQASSTEADPYSSQGACLGARDDRIAPTLLMGQGLGPFTRLDHQLPLSCRSEKGFRKGVVAFRKRISASGAWRTEAPTDGVLSRIC